MIRKVIIIVVEGQSDEFMLKKFLEKRYSTRRINFKVCSGDLLIKSPNTNIRNTVGNLIKEVIKYEKFKPKDILAVIHLTDTDGCMIDEDVIEIVKDLKLKLNMN